MITNFDKNLLPEFDSIKDKNEKILWTGKPTFIPFVLTGLSIGLVFIIAGLYMFFMAKNAKTDDGSFGGFGYLFALIPVAVGLWSFLKRLLSYTNTFYAYSDKRAMIRTGFIGTGFKIIDYDKISDIEVKVNFIERIYNVGTIKFFSGRTQKNDNGTTKLYDNWDSIPNPYDVFKRVKEVMVDIKTDYNYPNALRPDTNPGYKTEYKPD